MNDDVIERLRESLARLSTLREDVKGRVAAFAPLAPVVPGGQKILGVAKNVDSIIEVAHGAVVTCADAIGTAVETVTAEVERVSNEVRQVLDSAQDGQR